MFVKKYGDIIVSIFYAIMGAACIIGAKALPKSEVMEVGPDFMPTLIGVITLILAAILLVTSLIGFKENARKAEEAGAPACDYLRVALAFIGIVIYAFLFKAVGFIILTIFFLPFEMFNLCPTDKRSKKELILLCVIGVVFTFVVYFLFRYGFTIILPTGPINL